MSSRLLSESPAIRSPPCSNKTFVGQNSDRCHSTISFSVPSLQCLPPPFSLDLCRDVALTLITRLLLLVCSSSCTHISCNRPDLVRFCAQCYVLHFCVVYALFPCSSCCRTAVQNNPGVCTCGPTKVAGLLPERHATLVIVITVDA